MTTNDQALIQTLLGVFDLSGTFVFALSGGMDGVKHRLDLFGVLVLSFAAGNAGGMARDVLIGAIPPAAITDWRYIAVSVLAGILTFSRPRLVHSFRSPVMILDAAGLALFAVAGTGKALAFNAPPGAAILLGMLTGVGGGMVRDLLVREIPTVLMPTQVYAVAALLGATVMVIGMRLHFPVYSSSVAGALLCFIVRYLAIRRAWRLPVAPAFELPEEDIQQR